jgi:outer membrane lipopolysaccharide assembly protein LptE/RlpB
MRSTRFWAIVIILAALLSGCGYELVRDKGIFSGEMTTVTVPIFKNPTYEPHVSMYVTEAFTKELMATGVFKLDRTGTDGYIEGTIKDIRIIPNTLSKSGIVTEKKLFMDLELVLYKNNGVFMRRWMFTDNEVYRADIPNLEEYNKKTAYGRISDRMARRFSAAILVNY